MRFLADENFPWASVIKLRAAGHDVLHMSDLAAGSSDEIVVQLGIERRRAILTFDSDIGTIAILKALSVPEGIIHFRLTSYSPSTPAEILLDHMEANPEAEFNGRITVFDPPRVRQRMLG
jgi:predicted nuclease of predicted toxin-antitoxin system